MVDKKLFFYLALGFIIFTVVGTLSHEFGHYFAAKFFGLDAEVHYGYTSWGNSTPEQWKALSETDRFWLTLGGPVQTMLTGTIGFLLIIFNKKSFLRAEKLNLNQWFLVFLAFFWSRQIANYAVGIMYFAINGKFSKMDDESGIDSFFDVPDNTTGTITCIIGLMICMTTIFKFIPKQQRLTFILAGFIGGILGYLFWLEYFGPMILP